MTTARSKQPFSFCSVQAAAGGIRAVLFYFIYPNCSTGGREVAKAPAGVEISLLAQVGGITQAPLSHDDPSRTLS